MFKSQAPGKLILIGEYAVLFGAPAISMAVDRYAIAVLKPSENERFKLSTSPIDGISCHFSLVDNGEVRFDAGVQKNTRHDLRYFIFAFQEAYKFLHDLGMIIGPLDIALDTTSFFNKDNTLKLGIGSSAAISVAIYGGLLSFFKKNERYIFQKRNLFENTSKLHNLAQGKIGSGIDVATSVYGGFLKYQLSDTNVASSAEITELRWPSDLYILSVWTGRPASTIKLVNKVKQLQHRDQKKFSKIIDEMSELAISACDVISKSATTEFLEIIEKYFYVLKRLGDISDAPIISKEHRQLADIVYRSDGAVYKTSGAGGGDFGLVLCSSLDEITNLKKQLEKQGVPIMDISLSQQGFHIKT